MIKKVLIITIALFLLLGAVHASDNANDTSAPAIGEVPEKTSEISKITSKITANKVSGKENKKVNIKAVLKDGNGKLIKNKKVTFKIRGKTYTKTTDKNGVATLKYKLPKAKYLKTITKKKGNIVIKKHIYQTTNTVKITFKQSGNYTSSSATAKVISKKSPVIKKYRFKKITKTDIVPVKKGDYTYKRGPVTIQVILGKDFEFDDLWIAADMPKKSTRLQISTKIHYKDKHGNWKWEKKWTPTMSDHDLIVSYYGKLPKIDLIKVKYTIPSYKLIK